jgi:hypothetical protein
MYFKKGKLKPTFILPIFLDDFDIPQNESLSKFIPTNDLKRILLNPVECLSANEFLLEYLEWVKISKIHVELKQARILRMIF